MSIGQTAKKETPAPDFTESDLEYLRKESEFLERLLSKRARREAERRGWRAGREEGKQEGRAEGVRSACLQLWRRRFGEPEAWIVERLQQCSSHEALSQLLLELAEARDPEPASALIRKLDVTAP